MGDRQARVNVVVHVGRGASIANIDAKLVNYMWCEAADFRCKHHFEAAMILA